MEEDCADSAYNHEGMFSSCSPNIHLYRRLTACVNVRALCLHAHPLLVLGTPAVCVTTFILIFPGHSSRSHKPAQ